VVDAKDESALPSLKKRRVAERPGVQGVRTARLPAAGSNSVAPPSQRIPRGVLPPDDPWSEEFARGVTPFKR
jgi:hypothetical protein